MPSLRGFLPGNWSPRQRIAGIILFGSYLIGAQVGISLFTSPAVIVPAAGIALAGLVLEGISIWPALYAAALVSLIFNGSPFIYILFFPIVQTFQAVAGAYILKKFNFDPLLRRLQDMFLIIAVALTTSTIVPTLGTLLRYIYILLGGTTTTELTWGSWWTGHILSLLIFAPFIIRWFADPFFKRTRWQIVELVSVFSILFIIDYLLSWTPLAQLGGISLVYFLLLPLFWMAIRLGLRFTISGLFFTSAIILVGAFYAHVPHPADNLGLRIFQLEIFINIIAVIFYIIAGLQEERTEAIKTLHSYIEKLEDALNRLSLQDRAKTDFIAVLAHELRNPLAPIVSSLEFLKLNHPKTGEEGEALDLMDDRLKTIQRLLDDLLDVSRISRSKLHLKKARIDLRPIIDHSIQSVERNIKNRQQKLVIDIPHEPMVLDADSVRVEQVISNLLTNASKFTSEGGRILISAKREGDNAVIRIVDNGIGIDPVMLEKIFEPFLQLETGERKGEGLGIGLSLTQKLVEMHGGVIRAKSAGINHGSEFVVRFPLLPTNTQATVPEVKFTLTARSTPLSAEESTILVVDDNISAAHGIGKLLEHTGYKVTYAYTGSDAKEKITASAPHTIVLDIGLPDMDGHDLARMLRLGMNFKGKLIALTGYGQEEDKQRAFEAGFDHHLTKPISIKDLEAILSSS